MLTRAQIQRLAQRQGVGAQVQERDYIQHLVLYLLYTRGQDFIFKGGTALRIAYRGNPYSEDLDFNGAGNPDAVQSAWARVVSSMDDFGIPAQVRNEWQSEFSYSFDISFQGPLYDGRDRSKGKIRVDISSRQEAVNTHQVLVSSEYDDIRSFVLTILAPHEMLAEKIRALLVRGKPRDAYDIWLLLKQGVQLDWELVTKKLAIYERAFTSRDMDDAIHQARQDWERDLLPLLPQFIPWEIVAGELASLLR